MKRLALFLLWSCVFLALLVGIDQLLLRVPFAAPVLREVREFHLDFRHRLLHLPQGNREPQRPPVAPEPKPKPTAEQGRKPSGGTPAEKKPGQPAGSPGFLYVDDAGNLQFADTLEEIPARYRGEARPMQP